MEILFNILLILLYLFIYLFVCLFSLISLFYIFNLKQNF